MNEKQRLLQTAKTAYYTGNPIMSDDEYDALECELGLENKTDIGYHSTNYNIKHPFTMGSLSKIQIKNDDKTWEEYLFMLRKYCRWWNIEISPKFDGCSFEIVLDNKGGLISCSTRGDGEWGKDIYIHIQKQIDAFKKAFIQILPQIPNKYNGYVFRGEVLIDKDLFENKYKKSYVNTRAFVAGSLNNDLYHKSDDDLSLVFYDMRSVDGKHMCLYSPYFSEMRNMLMKTNVCIYNPELKDIRTAEDLQCVYAYYEEMRKFCKYSLDGIVLKTPVEHRSIAFDTRPKDCVAIKFKPAIETSEIIDIEWNLSPKTGEYFPVGIIKEVILDSKSVNRVSLANYGNILNKGCGVGAKVLISMAGDIIPFLYDVVTPSKIINNLPKDTYVSGTHLYKNLCEADKFRQLFLSSCDVLNISGLGPKLAEALYDFEPVNHILLFDFEQYDRLTNTKTSRNIKDSVKKYINSMSLAQLIESLSIPFCGKRLSIQCEKYLLYGKEKASFDSMATAGYKWILDRSSPEYSRLDAIKQLIEKKYNKTFKRIALENNKKTTKVILTGSPKEFGYKSKVDFLAKHQELEEVSNFADADILITDDMSSTSSKMLKAQKLNIPIKIYN